MSSWQEKNTVNKVITNTTLENVLTTQMTNEGSFNFFIKDSYKSMRKRPIIQQLNVQSIHSLAHQESAEPL